MIKFTKNLFESRKSDICVDLYPKGYFPTSGEQDL